MLPSLCFELSHMVDMLKRKFLPVFLLNFFPDSFETAGIDGVQILLIQLRGILQ